MSDQTPECTAACSEQHTYTAGCAAGYCPHCGRGDVAPTADDYEQLRQRAEKAEAGIEEACEWARRNLPIEQRHMLIEILRGPELHAEESRS